MSLSHNAGVECGYARISTNDQNRRPASRRLEASRMQNGFKDEGLSGCEDEPPCPVALDLATGRKRT